MPDWTADKQVYTNRMVVPIRFTQPVDSFYEVVLSSDGSQALTTAFGGVVQLWESATGQMLRRYVVTDSVLIDAVGYDLAGDQFVVIVGDEAASHCATTGECLQRLSEQDGAALIRQWVGPRSERESADGTIRAELCSGKVTIYHQDRQVQLQSFGVRAWDLRWPTKDTLIVQTHDGFRVFGTHPSPPQHGWYRSDTRGCKLSPDVGSSTTKMTKFRVACSDGESFAIRDLEGRQIVSLERGDWDEGGLFWGHLGEVLVIACGQELTVFDANTGLRRFSFRVDFEVFHAAFSPDDRQIVVAGRDSAVDVHDIDTARLLTRLAGHSDFVSTVAWRPDSTVIGCATADGEVVLWRPTGQRLHQFRHPRRANLLVWSPDGRWLFSSSLGHTVIRDGASGQPLHTLDMGQEWIYSAVWRCDSRRLATLTFAGTLQFWDPTTGQATDSTVELLPEGEWALRDPQTRHISVASPAAAQFLGYPTVVAGRPARAPWSAAG